MALEQRVAELEKRVERLEAAKESVQVSLDGRKIGEALAVKINHKKGAWDKK